MARNRKAHHNHSTDTLDSQVANDQVEKHNVETLTKGQPEGHETSTAPEAKNTINVPSEIAQEIWESLREEFYEQIEQLPLSLHRSFALIGEQDQEVQACKAELLPTIRSYVRLRQSIQGYVEMPAHGYDYYSTNQVVSSPGSTSPDPGVQFANSDVEIAERQPSSKSPESTESPQPQKTSQKEEDLDIAIEGVPLRLPYSTQCSTTNDFRPHNSQSPTKSSSQHNSQPNSVTKPSQPTATRTQGLRESDATVPKSVPFPPRPKPKTTRELLTRISFLTREQLRASEEKVALATAVYDSVDRHVRALDAAIREYQDVGGPADSECHDEKTMQEGIDTAIHEGEGEDDEEPQLGMIGPLAETAGSGAPRLRNRKRDRRSQQTHLADVQPLTRVHALSTTTSQELPVDPHEPRYCYCNQVSYGEMIACDNADCSREWFHLGCAGLAAPPKGKVKWYCRGCEEMLGSNRRRRIR